MNEIDSEYILTYLKTCFNNINIVILEDSVQSAILRYLEHPEKYNSKKSKLNTYLIMIAKCITIDYLRRQKKIIYLEELN